MSDSLSTQKRRQRYINIGTFCLLFVLVVLLLIFLIGGNKTVPATNDPVREAVRYQIQLDSLSVVRMEANSAEQARKDSVRVARKAAKKPKVEKSVPQRSFLDENPRVNDGASN